jgi:hypothetical protein
VACSRPFEIDEPRQGRISEATVLPGRRLGDPYPSDEPT